LTHIEYDTEIQPHFEHKKEMQLVRSRESEYLTKIGKDVNYEFESVVVNIPILQNPNLRRIFELQSSTFNLGGDPDYSLGETAIKLKIPVKGFGYSHDDERVANEVTNHIDRIKVIVQRKNADILNENKRFEQAIRGAIVSRKQKLISDRSRFASLVERINIPLKRVEDDSTARIKIDPRPIVHRIKPNPILPEEYVLDRAKVIDIISVLDSQGRQFEKTPRSYQALGEEQLRDILLSSLNTLFEGKATGETFSKNGKTDIYLNIDQGNILIFECKIWGGQALYNDTIDQLRGYLTWRQNFGVMITFGRQKNFTNILSVASDAIQKSPSFRRGFSKISETHFLSFFPFD